MRLRSEPAPKSDRKKPEEAMSLDIASFHFGGSRFSGISPSSSNGAGKSAQFESLAGCPFPQILETRPVAP